MRDAEQVGPGFRGMIPWIFVGGVAMWGVIAFTILHGVILVQEWRYRRGPKELPHILRSYSAGRIDHLDTTTMSVTTSTVILVSDADIRMMRAPFCYERMETAAPKILPWIKKMDLEGWDIVGINSCDFFFRRRTHAKTKTLDR